MSYIFYYLRSPPKCSLKCLLRRLTVPILYIITDYDNTVTYRCDGCSRDIKGIQAPPFEVIPICIIKFHETIWARPAYYCHVNVVICPRVRTWSSFRDYLETRCRKELKMVMEAFRINIVISRLTEFWCLTPSHSRRLCQVETQGIKSQATVLLTDNDTWHFFFSLQSVWTVNSMHSRNTSNPVKSRSIHLTLKPSFPFSVPTQISSVPFSSFLRPIGLSGRHKWRFSR